MGCVVIPFNYEELPEDRRKSIVPICIPAIDRFGNAIAPVWFEKGVLPVQEPLRNIARIKLRDVWRVSELVEIVVHKLWERHGAEAGFCPWRRVLVRAPCGRPKSSSLEIQSGGLPGPSHFRWNR